MFRRLLLTVFAVVLALSVIGIAATGVSAQDPLKIGLMNDRTGALQQYGKELHHGFMLGLMYATGGTMEVAGRPIEVLERDNAGQPPLGASQAREVIERDGAEILVGAPSSGVALQLQQVAEELGVILMAGPSASPTITSTNFMMNTFRVCRNSFQDALTLARVAPSLGVTRVAIFAADYDFGRGTAAAFQASYGAAGLEVLEPLFAPLDTTDFTPYIDQILASGADALQPIWAGDNSVALYNQLAERQVRNSMIVIEAMNSNPIVQAAFSASQVDSIGYMVYHYTLPDTEINDWLVENHLSTFDGEYPDLFTECGFATAQALVAGLEATGGDTEPETLIAALEGLTFDGPRGMYWIRPADHQAMMPMYIVRLTNNTDPEFRFYELVQEVPASQVIPPCVLPEAYLDRCADPDLTTPPDALMEAEAGG